MNDKTKVLIFKTTTIVLATSVLKQSIVYNFAVSAFSLQCSRLRKIAQLNNRVVQRFFELAPPDVSAQIRKEFEFDLITFNMDILEGGENRK